MIDIREPRKIRQYGEGDAFEPTPPPQPYEPPPEVKARYRKYKIFTITTFALLFLLLTQGVILITLRVLKPQPLFMQTFPLLIEIAILVILYAIYRYEQNMCDPLSMSNMIVIIIGEGVFIVAMFLMYHFEMSWLINALAVFSIAFALYIFIFVKAGFRFRLVMCIVIAVSFFVTDIVALNVLEFTPRYIYISTGGYQDKNNDETNYYFDNNAERSTIDDKELNQIIEQTKVLSSLGWSVQRVNEIGRGNSLGFFNTMFENNVRLGDLVNAEDRYDDRFFEKKSLFLSFIRLENPNDTVEITDIDYATLFSKPYITYTRSNSSKSTDDTNTKERARAICLVVLEVSKAEEEKVSDKMIGFLSDNAVIKYQ